MSDTQTDVDGKREKNSQRNDSASDSAGGSRWTFLTNHTHVLSVLHSEPDIVLREVAVKVGITERAVQRIVQELEECGVLKRIKVGRKNHYQVIKSRPLRHPLESHCNIGRLLELIMP